MIFRNPMLEMPAMQGSVSTFNPMRTAKLNEEQIQEVLLLALSEGGLAAARANYENNMITDAATAIFTIDAGGVNKTVSIYALGMDAPDGADGAGPRRLPEAGRAARRLRPGWLARDAMSTSRRPIAAPIMDSPGVVAPDIRDWPWPDLTVADFKPDATRTGSSSRTGR